jgi:translation initiation factor IF-3
MDLLIVSLDSTPPVVRLVDYGKFKYENEKKQREAKKKQHVTTVKEIKLSVRISDHDYQVKVAHAKRFLEEHDKVKLTIRLKGREMQHSNLAFDLANRFVLQLEELGTPESRVRLEGRSVVAVFSPKPAGAPAKKAPAPRAVAITAKLESSPNAVPSLPAEPTEGTAATPDAPDAS